MRMYQRVSGSARSTRARKPHGIERILDVNNVMFHGRVVRMIWNSILVYPTLNIHWTHRKKQISRKTKCDRKQSNEGSKQRNFQIRMQHSSVFVILIWRNTKWVCSLKIDSKGQYNIIQKTLSTVKTEQDSGIWGIRALGLWNALSTENKITFWGKSNWIPKWNLPFVSEEVKEKHRIAINLQYATIKDTRSK
jgi:hypothetical protein